MINNIETNVLINELKRRGISGNEMLQFLGSDFIVAEKQPSEKIPEKKTEQRSDQMLLVLKKKTYNLKPSIYYFPKTVSFNNMEGWSCARYEEEEIDFWIDIKKAIRESNELKRNR